MNKEAGRGGDLIITLRLRDGEKLPLVLDTGTSGTLLDESLAPKLGKPLGTVDIQHWGKHETENLYAMPKLYLGNTLLTGTNDHIVTYDLKSKLSQEGDSVMGILGLDVLAHYCIQLDFAAGKIRFLDDAQADTNNWGKAFPMVPLNDSDPRPAVAQNLLGVQGPHSLIDSGYLGDGWLMPKYFHQWTNSALVLTNGEVHSPDGSFDREKYPGVILDLKNVESDGIGIDFLARHLVTLDFPKHTLYLKRTSDYRLLYKDRMMKATTMAKSAIKYLAQLKRKNQLPGASENEPGKTTHFDFHHTPSPYLDSITIDTKLNNQPSLYHYTCVRTSRNGSWKLQKAWRTDSDGKMLEEYPIP